MTYKYTLPESWVVKLLQMEEFANGGMQVTIRLWDGRVFESVLISACEHIVAIRGYRDLPFALEDIAEIYQTADDRNPNPRGAWDWWD